MFPAEGSAYVPASVEPPPPLTDEYVRENGVVVVSRGDSGLAEVHQGLVVSFVRVRLDADGKILGIAPYAINNYCRTVPKPS